MEEIPLSIVEPDVKDDLSGYRVNHDLAHLDCTRPCEQVTAWFRESQQVLRKSATES